MTFTATGSLRCSVWARSQDLDPAGTAGSYSGYLVVDVPLPWPRDVSEVPEIAALEDLLSGSGLRVQATVPAGPRRSVTLYERNAGGWTGELTGRTVVAMMSANHIDPDLAAEIYVLDAPPDRQP